MVAAPTTWRETRFPRGAHGPGQPACMRVVGASCRGGACWRGRPSQCPEAGGLPPGGGGRPPLTRPRGRDGGQTGAGWRWGPLHHHRRILGAPSPCLCSHLAGPEKLGISRSISSRPPRRSSPQCRRVPPTPRAQGQPGGLFITSLDSGRFHRLAFCLKLLRTGVDKVAFRSLLSMLWGQTLLFWEIMPH